MGLPPVIINDIKLEPKSELHRRKLEALRRFVERLLSSPVRGDIAKIILFGSALDGKVEEESDVDLLVFGARNLAAVDEACTDASFEVGLETMESLEPLVYGLSDLYVPDSYFIFTALRNGKEIYSMEERELIRKAAENHFLLATEYLEAAERSRADGHLRVAIDAAYNAAELCAKGFLLGKVKKMPTGHGATIRLFSDLYIKTEALPTKLGRRLNRSLELRNKARYEYEAVITEDMAEETIELARSMLDHLKNYILEELR